MKILFFVLLCLFCIVGVSHIIFELLFCFFRLKDDSSFIVIIPNKNNELDLEFKVRSAVAKMKKLYKKSYCDIYVISDSLDEYSQKELKLLQKDREYLKVMKKSDFLKETRLK